MGSKMDRSRFKQRKAVGSRESSSSSYEPSDDFHSPPPNRNTRKKNAPGSKRPRSTSSSSASSPEVVDRGHLKRTTTSGKICYRESVSESPERPQTPPQATNKYQTPRQKSTKSKNSKSKSHVKPISSIPKASAKSQKKKHRNLTSTWTSLSEKKNKKSPKVTRNRNSSSRLYESRTSEPDEVSEASSSSPIKKNEQKKIRPKITSATPPKFHGSDTIENEATHLTKCSNFTCTRCYPLGEPFVVGLQPIVNNTIKPKNQRVKTIDFGVQRQVFQDRYLKRKKWLVGLQKGYRASLRKKEVVEYQWQEKMKSVEGVLNVVGEWVDNHNERLLQADAISEWGAVDGKNLSDMEGDERARRVVELEVSREELYHTWLSIGYRITH